MWTSELSTPFKQQGKKSCEKSGLNGGYHLILNNFNSKQFENEQLLKKTKATYRINTTWQCFSKNNDIWTHILMING